MALPSSLTRLLRAAASHRNATPLFRLHGHHHPSPTSLLHSHSSNLHISKPHLFSFSTSRRVHTRATALQNPRSPRSIWPYGIAFGCLATGLIVMVLKKPREESVVAFGLKASVSGEKELRFQGALPDMYRKGHCVVVEGLLRPVKTEIKNDNAKVKNVVGKAKGWECFFSATEVLSKPVEIAQAMERNAKIMADKQNVAQAKKPNVAQGKKQIVAEEEQEAAVDWYTTPSDDISKSADDPLKSESRPEELVLEAMNNQSAFDSKAFSPELESLITELIEYFLGKFKGLPEVLQEGHSFVIKAFVKAITDEIKKGDKSAKRVTVKARGWEGHFLGEVVAKHDEKYMTEEVAATAAAIKN